MKCSFCSTDIAVGTGVKVFKRDGTLTAFCSRKCERNAEMGRKPRKLKWTGAGKARTTKK